MNFRLFSVNKERSEFEKCSVSSKILLFQNPSTPDFYIAELKGSDAKRSLHRQAFRHAIGLAFSLFRDASIRAAIMDARPKGIGGQTPPQIPVNVDPAKKICSVNFRLFSADKERSEFESCSVSSKILWFKIKSLRLKTCSLII